MDPRILPCAICQLPCSHLGARGRNVVCHSCESKATTIDGRPLEFYDGFKKENGVTYFMGPDPEAGTEYSEIWEKGIWIEGRQVELYEGVAGWLGLIVR